MGDVDMSAWRRTWPTPPKKPPLPRGKGSKNRVRQAGNATLARGRAVPVLPLPSAAGHETAASRLGADFAPERPAESHILGPERLGDTTCRGIVDLARVWLPTCVSASGGPQLCWGPPFLVRSSHRSTYQNGCATTCLTYPKMPGNLDLGNWAGREDHSIEVLDNHR